MEKVADSKEFKDRQNIVLEGFDPVSSGGFTQVPNTLFNTSNGNGNGPRLGFAAIVVYAKLLSYAWTHNRVFPGQQRMATDLSCAVSTISEAITELRRRGWIDVIRQGQGKTNIYVLRTVVKKKRH
jgi:hypothetical protein